MDLTFGRCAQSHAVTGEIPTNVVIQRIRHLWRVPRVLRRTRHLQLSGEECKQRVVEYGLNIHYGNARYYIDCSMYCVYANYYDTGFKLM